ncbi:MAG: MMPL family transporter [Planctomycetaceae bacterium]|nr:MMPL family transporter [Planctomycetaceae bacterium]
MYRRIGLFVSRHPWLIIALWTIVVIVAGVSAPYGPSVWQDGEFAFLPESSPSRRAERLFREAFPAVNGERFSEDVESRVGTSLQQDPLGSSIVIALERIDDPYGLQEKDWKFVQEELIPRLELLQRKSPSGYSDLDEHPTPASWESLPDVPVGERVIQGISTPSDNRVGTLLRSPDQRAALIVIDLKTEFLDRQNSLIVARLENLLESRDFRVLKPVGMVMALSGSATVGRDMLRAENESGSRTEMYTKVLVIVLLLLIYRSPLLALVPLVTVGVAVELTRFLLRLMAAEEWIGLFTGLEVYVTVVVYGAGVDYCLFLIARYREELDRGLAFRESMSHSIWRVGAALATSAGTSIVGIAMMTAAEFGKFRQAGVAISFGLFVVLCFALTFTPAFLLVLGRWAFWPDVRQERLHSDAGWFPAASFWRVLQEHDWIGKSWDFIAKSLERRPGTIFAVTCLILLPFAAIGFQQQQNLSYGLLTDLPATEPSVIGARVVQNHFAAGVTGPATVLLKFNESDLTGFDTHQNAETDSVPADDAAEQTAAATDLLDSQKALRISEAIYTGLQGKADTLRLEDIRCQLHPLGTTDPALQYMKDATSGRGPVDTYRKRKLVNAFAHRTYTSTHGEAAGRVMRFDLVFRDDPFERESIDRLSDAEAAVREAIPAALRDKAEVVTFGPTAGIRDLKSSTDRDQIKIDVLVVISVYAMLVLLLRRPAICAYLIVSVAFSYLVAMGMTFAVFYLRDPAGFNGIDWKVPIYLFTILIAMGEDYNILLMSRVAEEQHEHGNIQGILVALKKTGSIISSCGIIMAGTFASLMSGSLLGMVQLGFALAFGVLLDTFVVRPILVPAYLIMLYRGDFGPLGKYLGSESTPAALDFGDDPVTASDDATAADEQSKTN